MVVMSKTVNLAFIVAEEKADEFINSKSTPSVMERIKNQAKEMMTHSTYNGEKWDNNIGKSLTID